MSTRRPSRKTQRRFDAIRSVYVALDTLLRTSTGAPTRASVSFRPRNAGISRSHR
jgi:hypothetical protein